jgi:hypothetical protein
MSEMKSRVVSLSINFAKIALPLIVKRSIVLVFPRGVLGHVVLPHQEWRGRRRLRHKQGSVLWAQQRFDSTALLSPVAGGAPQHRAHLRYCSSLTFSIQSTFLPLRDS